MHFFLLHLPSVWDADAYSIQLGIWPMWNNSLFYTAFPKAASAVLVEIK